jgi:hypothetical protein
MEIRRLVLTTAFLGIVIAAIVAMVRDAPGSGAIAFFATVAVVGGVIALIVRVRHPHPRGVVQDVFGPQVESTDVINVSRIRVAGIGGLGLVAVAVGISIALPRIGQSMILGAVGGALLAVAVIYYRRQHGPLDSSHAQPGGRSVLVEPELPPADETADTSKAPSDLRRVAAPLPRA